MCGVCVPLAKSELWRTVEQHGSSRAHPLAWCGSPCYTQSAPCCGRLRSPGWHACMLLWLPCHVTHLAGRPAHLPRCRGWLHVHRPCSTVFALAAACRLAGLAGGLVRYRPGIAGACAWGRAPLQWSRGQGVQHLGLPMCAGTASAEEAGGVSCVSQPLATRRLARAGPAGTLLWQRCSCHCC